MTEIPTREQILLNLSDATETLAAAKRTLAVYTAMRIKAEHTPGTPWDFITTLEDHEKQARANAEELRRAIDDFLDMSTFAKQLESEEESTREG